MVEMLLLYVHRNHSLTQDGHLDFDTAPELVWRWGKMEIIYLSLHCHHQNYFCIKVGSAESQFNVS